VAEFTENTGQTLEEGGSGAIAEKVITIQTAIKGRQFFEEKIG